MDEGKYIQPIWSNLLAILKQCKKINFDVILLKILMPNGEYLCQIVNKNSNFVVFSISITTKENNSLVNWTDKEIAVIHLNY